MEGLGFKRFRVLRSRVEGLGLRVEGLGLKGLEFKVEG